VLLPGGVRGPDGDGVGAAAGRHGAGGHGQHAGLPPPPLQVQGQAVRLDGTLLLGLRQRHVLLGTLRLQRGLLINITFFSQINICMFRSLLSRSIDDRKVKSIHSVDKRIAIHYIAEYVNRNSPRRGHPRFILRV
jgi:hypothetical protein